MASPSRKLAASAAAALAILAVVSAMAGTAVAHWNPQDYVDAHNRVRSHVGVPGVEWDDKVAEYARGYAAKRREDCNLWHSNGPYGENLFWGWWGHDWPAADAVASWAEEGRYYHYGTNECEHGHKCYLYTQVVWRASTRIGCAHVDCHDHRGVFVICNYHPAGNVLGQRPYGI